MLALEPWRSPVAVAPAVGVASIFCDFGLITCYQQVIDAVITIAPEVALPHKCEGQFDSLREGTSFLAISKKNPDIASAFPFG